MSVFVRVLLLVCLAQGSTAWAATALILDPPPGFKLYEGQRRPIEVRIALGDAGARWSLGLRAADGDEEELLAEGVGDVDGVVGELWAGTLRAGEAYELVLRTVGGEHRVPFMLPDPKYTLIPLTAGDFELNRMEGQSVDRSGRVVMFGARSPEFVNILDRQTGELRQWPITLTATAHQRLAGDGRRFFYEGFFSFDGETTMGIGYLDLSSGALVGMARGRTYQFAVDHTGERLAFQLTPNPTERLPKQQYYVFDGEEVIQITNSPDAVVASSGPLDCPRQIGSRPLITADGRQVVFVTRSTLGVDGVPADPGCKIFRYDVETRQLNYHYGFPPGEALDLPVLSDDGRWLSFGISRMVGAGRLASGALMDLQTGERTLPIAELDKDPTFDSVVTPDGSKIVFSTTADLDPRVGNSDRNMEIFTMDRESGLIEQVSDTAGGIGSRPGGCSSFRPAVDRSANVILFLFMTQSGGNCTVDGAQRANSNDLNLRGVRAVRRRPGNLGPVLSPAPSLHVEAGRLLELPMSAADPDGDPVSLFFQEVNTISIPEGATVRDDRRGNAVLSWRTKVTQVGLHRLRVAAFDEGGGEVFQDVLVRVGASADCDLDGVAETEEIKRCVTAALYPRAESPGCELCDPDSNGVVGIDELVRGVRSRL